MSHNTWIHRISRRLVRPLVNTPVTPNHLTTARLVTGVAAAGCFALDEGRWDVIGAGIFVISMLLDRADGELARMKGASSRFGAFYDLATDAISNSCLFFGLGIAAMDGVLGLWAVPVGLLAGISISTIFYLIIATEARFGQGTASFDAHAGFDPDDALILVPIGVLCGLGDLMLIGAGVCAPLAVMIIGHDLYRRGQRLSAKPPGGKNRRTGAVGIGLKQAD